MSTPQEKPDPEVEAELSDVSSRHKRPAPHPTRSAKVKCLRCGKSFVSWDLRLNRLCQACSKKSF